MDRMANDLGKGYERRLQLAACEGGFHRAEATGYISGLNNRGTSLVRNRPPPWESPTTLSTGIRYYFRRVRFLMGELPLCPKNEQVLPKG